MTLVKNTDGIKYEDSDKPKASKGSGKRTAVKAAEMLGTPSLVWLLVKRHKVAILAIGNVVLVLNWTVPEWPSIVRSLI